MTALVKSTTALASDTFTPDQLALIKATVAKNATNDELKLFLYRCKILDLDPLKPGQIHFVKYGNSPGTIVVGIDGFRARAAKTGKHVGTKRGIVRSDKGQCIGAWCEIYRSDWTHPARDEVSLAEYSTGKNNWSKMPETMIKKVAEVAALRIAFPDELSGLYSDDEMEQANHSRTVTDAPKQLKNHAPQAAEPVESPFDENTDDPLEAIGNTICPLKKFKGQRVRDIDPNQLMGYIKWLQDFSAKQGREPTGDVADFIEASKVWITQGAAS